MQSSRFDLHPLQQAKNDNTKSSIVIDRGWNMLSFSPRSKYPFPRKKSTLLELKFHEGLNYAIFELLGKFKNTLR